MKLYSADYIDELLSNFYSKIVTDTNRKIYDELNKTTTEMITIANNAKTVAIEYTDANIAETKTDLSTQIQNSINDITANINSNYLSLKGGTITGALYIKGDLYAQGQKLQMSHGSVISLSETKTNARIGIASNNNVFLANSEDKLFELTSNGSITYGGHQVYTAEFKPTPQDIGAALGTNGIANNSKQFNGYSLWIGTQDSYDSLAKYDSKTIYMITD